MTVELTSPALGKAVGATHTGPEEAWLLANGYAKQAGYTGPGVSNTGPSDTTPANELTLPENREPAPSVDTDTAVPDPDPVAYDFDAGGPTTEAPSDFTVEPAALALAGGKVTAEGQNFKGTTGVTVGGTAATNVAVVDDSTLTFTAPAKAAGTYDVVVTNPNGSKTETGALTYA
jgi:hypothetical protein